MIKRDDIKRLADLSRIDIGDKESDNLAKDMDSILQYVGQIKEATSSSVSGNVELGPVYNVMRADENPTEPGTYSKDIIAEFPEKEGDYLKVKKIL